MEAMRFFFNRHWQGNDTAAGSLPVLDSLNVYTWVLNLEGSLAFHFTSYVSRVRITTLVQSTNFDYRYYRRRGDSDFMAIVMFYALFSVYLFYLQPIILRYPNSFVL